jgi:hypoxanthine phosphoribosyltransferase
MNAERETLSCETFGSAIRELATKVKRSGYETDVILSIAQHFTLD